MGIVQNFRMVKSIKKMSNTTGRNDSISKRYDEPTYLSFKINFGISENKLYNDVSDSTSFDFMPHPLFQIPEGSSDEYLYSAVTYLRNINELERAEMLLEFIDVFNIIQSDYQWYFHTVNGIDTLFNVDTKRGKRLAQDASIEIQCLDSVDRRIYYLFSLYRKIAWDDTYQRWILPDMMRFFTMTIYITEFRHFHRPYNAATLSYVDNVGGDFTNEGSSKNLLKSVISDVKDASSKFMQNTFRTYNQNSNFEPIVLKLMDNIFPTHILKCEMCEFDINSFNCGQYSSLSVSESPDMCGFSFKVKVGKIIEKSNYPIFSRTLDDVLINGTSRTMESGYTKLSTDTQKNVAKMENNVANDITSIPINKRQHGSGEYYYENKSITDDPLNTSHTKSWINKNMYLNNATVLNRMVNNATTFGVAKLENMINDTVDSLKMQEIRPGLSFNSIQSMIASGDVISSLGMLRRAIEGTYDSNTDLIPSAKLDEMTDDAFRGLLDEYSKATVSLNEEPLQNAAKKALIDASYFDKIKDVSQALKDMATNNSIDGGMYEMQKEIDSSKATDMVGNDEINLYSTNIGGDKLQDSHNQIYMTTHSINKDGLYKEIEAMPSSKATNGVIIFEGKPSS